jgi:CheY-like chemotaxis protein
LRATPKPVVPANEQARSQRCPSACRLRVLLCDDNLINQKVATRLLGQMGYTPKIAGNGLEALAAIDSGVFDLIFMDVMMPEMDGLEATRQIRLRQKDRAVIPNYKVADDYRSDDGQRDARRQGKMSRSRHGRLFRPNPCARKKCGP